MISFLKRLLWDLRDPKVRFNYFNSFLMHMPGLAGIVLRSMIIPGYFAKTGKNVRILEGVRFKGIHRLSVGNNVNIGNDNFIQASGGVTLEDNVMLGPGVKIWSINHKFADLDTPIFEQGYDLDPVIIGKGSWLAANVFVMPGVSLPEGCIVSACSVVNKKSYKPFSIVSGNPCRIIGYRQKPDKSD